MAFPVALADILSLFRVVDKILQSVEISGEPSKHSHHTIIEAQYGHRLEGEFARFRRTVEQLEDCLGAASDITTDDDIPNSALEFEETLRSCNDMLEDFSSRLSEQRMAESDRAPHKLLLAASNDSRIYGKW